MLSPLYMCKEFNQSSSMWVKVEMYYTAGAARRKVLVKGRKAMDSITPKIMLLRGL